MEINLLQFFIWICIGVGIVIIINLIQYYSRIESFNLFVLVFIVATNFIFLIFSFIDQDFFGLLWKKLLILSITTVVLNYFLNHFLERRGIYDEIDWREDKKFIKAFVITGISLLVLFSAYTTWYTFPRDIDRQFSGVQFQLGGDLTESVTIVLDGTQKRSLSGSGTFEGLLRIRGEEGVLMPENESSVHLKYGKPINLIHYFDDGQYDIAGTIHTNGRLEELVILPFTDGSWSEEDGLVISAPADSRDEAEELYRELSGN